MSKESNIKTPNATRQSDPSHPRQQPRRVHRDVWEKPDRGWLLGPWIDAFLIANLGWPLLLVLGVWGDLFVGDSVRFWQVYFVTTPHRWITLALVFGDRRRFATRPLTFSLIALAVVGICGGVWVATGTLTCLLAIDYIWNAWHFAAQHHGIYRIYGRRRPDISPSPSNSEKWLFRLFIVYVALRVAGWSWAYPSINRTLGALDWLVALIPLWLLAREVMPGHRGERTGRILYLTSVVILYEAMLWAIHIARLDLLLLLATASALFHATEYLTIVSWSVHRGAPPNRSHLWGRLVGNWGLFLIALIAMLGVGGWYLDQTAIQVWLFINVIVAFLHYAYDGMIWKRPAGRDAA